MHQCNRSFDTTILITFRKQHHHTFKNDVPIQLSLFLHFYLLYMLLNSSDGNDAKRNVFSAVDCWSVEKTVTCTQEEQLSHQQSFENHNRIHNRLFRATNSLPRKTCYAGHFSAHMTDSGLWQTAAYDVQTIQTRFRTDICHFISSPSITNAHTCFQIFY